MGEWIRSPICMGISLGHFWSPGTLLPSAKFSLALNWWIVKSVAMSPLAATLTLSSLPNSTSAGIPWGSGTPVSLIPAVSWNDSHASSLCHLLVFPWGVTTVQSFSAGCHQSFSESLLWRQSTGTVSICHHLLLKDRHGWWAQDVQKINLELTPF